MNEMDQILMREHHLENETLSLKAKGLFSTPRPSARSTWIPKIHCPT